MNIENNLIKTKCPLFACRVCRTKAGYSHQLWCLIAYKTNLKCDDCGYFDTSQKECVHSTFKGKERDAI